MKNRTCVLRLWICNDKGEVTYYRLLPLAAVELGASVAAFRLLKDGTPTDPSAPVYVARLAADGQVTCNCPAHNFAGQCKHADALAASGVLPCSLIGLLQQRTRLLEQAETECQRIAEAAMTERTVYEQDAQVAEEQIAELTATVNDLAARAKRLQDEAEAYRSAGPKRRRTTKKAA